MKPLIYALLSQKAYNVPPMVGAEESSARAILETTEDGLAVAFRGSDDTHAWLADLNVVIDDIGGLGHIHQGFWESFKLVRKELLQKSPVVVTGHSLGAALAIIYAGVLCLVGKPPKAVFAWEPPHVGIDGTLAHLFTTNGVRLFYYRNGLDLVVNVPLPLPEFWWQHASRLIPIGEEARPFPNIEDHNICRVVEAAGLLPPVS